MENRTRVKKLIFAGLVTAFLAGLLSGCGKGEVEEAEERVLCVDYTEELAVQSAEQVICGQQSAWAVTSVKNNPIYRLSHAAQGTTDEAQSQGMGAEIEELAWQPGEGDYFIINIAEQNGILYAECHKLEEDVLEIRKYRESVGWSSVMTIKSDQEGWGIAGSGLFVDGSENIYLVNGNTVARFEGEGKQTCEYELKGSICTFRENKEGTVLCVTADANSIRLYELRENSALEKWIRKESEAVGQVHAISSREAGLLCLASNEELLFLDMESGALLARTDLVKIGVSSVMAGYYDGKEGTLWLYGSAGNGSEGLYCSHLSGRDAAEQRTELVYGMIGEMNAYTDSSIWTAITAFNQKNEEYYIKIKNYGGWAGQERFNAELAAGNGPDIIDMTYFADDYGSYVRNGYLENLSPYLEQSEYKDDILWNVLNVYQIDGGIYMFIPQFQLWGLLIHPDYADQVEEWNLETCLELIEKDRWEKIIFEGWQEPEEILLYYLLFGMQEDLIDREQKKANFETEEFLDILALCREYGEMKPDAAGWTADDWTWNRLYSTWLAGSEFYNYVFQTDIYGREYPIYGYPTLSGQVYGVSSTFDGCAIYAGSENKEGAWEFIESLLWDSNQRCLGIAQAGFPIRRSILEELEEGAKEVECLVNSQKLRITDSEIEIQRDIICHGEFVNFSAMIDSDIWAVVQEEAESYFSGDKTAGEAAHIIQSRVGIILGE